MTLVYLGLAWLLGIYLASIFLLPAWLWGMWLLFGAILAIWRRSQLTPRLVGLSIVFLALGTFRYQSAIPTLDAGDLAFYNDREVIWEGVVAADPIIRDRYVDLRVEARRLQVNNWWRSIKGVALVRVSRFSNFEYGDLLRLGGELEPPPEFEDFS